MFNKEFDSTYDCSKCRKRILSLSFAMIISSTIIKAVAGIICGSRVLVSNALSSFTDCINIGVNYVGSRSRTPDPFGQSLIIATIMFLSAVWVCAANAVAFISGVMLRPGLWALFISVVATLVNWQQYRTTACAHQSKLDDQNVLLCMILSRSDFIASGITSAGIVLTLAGLLFFDPLCGILIGCIMFRESFDILDHAFAKQGPSGASRKRLAMYTAGLLSCCIIGFYINDALGILYRRAIILVPSQGAQIDSPVDKLLGRAQFFMIINTNDNTIKSITNTSRYLKTDVSNDLLAMLKDNDVGVILAQNLGAELFTDLRIEGVRIYYFDKPGTIRSTLSDYQNGQLKLATGPTVNKGFGRSEIRLFSPW